MARSEILLVQQCTHARSRFHGNSLVPRRPRFIPQLCICDFPIVYVLIGVNDMLGDHRDVWTENFVYVCPACSIRCQSSSFSTLLVPVAVNRKPSYLFRNLDSAPSSSLTPPPLSLAKTLYSHSTSLYPGV